MAMAMIEVAYHLGSKLDFDHVLFLGHGKVAEYDDREKLSSQDLLLSKFHRSKISGEYPLSSLVLPSFIEHNLLDYLTRTPCKAGRSK